MAEEILKAFGSIPDHFGERPVYTPCLQIEQELIFVICRLQSHQNLP